MKVIIPIAGLGTRLYPHTRKRQKCLLPVAGKPVIDHIVEPLIQQGFDRIVLITGHLEDQVKDYVKKYDAEFTFARQDEALGLGHAIFKGLKNNNDPVLIQLGDVIYDIDFEEFCNSSNHVIAVEEVSNPERFGIVEVDGNRIIKVLEKPSNPPTNLGIIGLYYLTEQKPMHQAIKYLMDNDITTNNEVQLADAYQILIEWGSLVTAQSVSQWYDCGIPETFLSTNRRLLKSFHDHIEGSTIIDPVHIGNNCTISNSTIGPNVTIMDGVHITDSTIMDSIVLWNARIKNKRIERRIVEEGD